MVYLDERFTAPIRSHPLVSACHGCLFHLILSIVGFSSSVVINVIWSNICVLVKIIREEKMKIKHIQFECGREKMYV